MEKWQKFLDSLATNGGQLFILVLVTFSLMALVLHVLHNSDNVQATDVIITAFSGAFGALLGYLTGHAVGSRKADIPPEPPK